MNYSLTFLKIAAALCFMMPFLASAQSQDITLPAVITNTVSANLSGGTAKPEIAKEINVTATIKEQLAETKIQRRKRKKQDPILIPYRLNKKTFSLS